MPLVEKVAACRAELGTADGSIPSQLAEIGRALGIEKELACKSLVEQADVCFKTLFGDKGMSSIVGDAIPTGAIVYAEPVLPSATAVAVPSASAAAAPDVYAEPVLPSATAVPVPSASAAAAPDVPDRGLLWDRSVHANGGPRGDQNLPCLTLCCGLPFALCPVHCLSAWGCADAVGALTRHPTCRDVSCCPCSPNSKNPLWCCAEPLGWAASLGQLHTVMALVANGANPHTKNAAGENAFTDAARKKHQHVVSWLKQWEAAGRPGAPANQAMDRGAGGAAANLASSQTQGCYVGACIIPILITTFWVQAQGPDEIRASGVTLVFPWSYTLKRSEHSRTVFELRAPDQKQDWAFHNSGCCFWGSPGWWALKVVPGNCC